MAKTKERIPFTAAWRAKYRGKVTKDKMDDKQLLDKEVKHRRTLYQISISAGFYIGAHTASAVATSGVTIPFAVIQLSWQAYTAIQASWKHKVCIEEIYRRGLSPRNMTTAEKAKTAFWASLSVAIGQAMDAIGSTAIEDSFTNSTDGMMQGGGATAMSSVASNMANNVGGVVTEAAAKGGALALSVVTDMLATGALAGAGIAVSKGVHVVSTSDWASERRRLPRVDRHDVHQKSTNTALTVQVNCTECKRRFTTSLCSSTARTCSACQMRSFTQRDKVDTKDEKEKMEKRDSDSIAALHLGTFCDGCCGGIVGTRYACMECEDYDLCERCYHTSAVHEMHVLNHTFDEVVLPAYSTTQMVYLELGLQQHEDIFCDGCQKDLTGLRARCTVCPYYDLVRTAQTFFREDRLINSAQCQDCLGGKIGAQHPFDHAFEFTVN